MTQATRRGMAELDEALGVERELLDRLLFKLVVGRLVRQAGDEADCDVAHRHFERTAAAMRTAPAPHLSIIARLCGSEQTTTDGLAMLAASAPEPYKTMFEAHLAELGLIQDELTGARDSAPTRSDPQWEVLESVLYTAARGRLSGCVAPGLADFVSPGIHRPAGDDA